MTSGGRARRAGSLAHLPERIVRLFGLRAPITDERTLTSRLLNGLHLVSLPILLTIFAVRLFLGKGLTEVEDLTLMALIAANLLAALLLRFGRVNLSGFVLTYALWAAGIFNAWMNFGFQNIASVFPLLAVLIACLVLPWSAGVLLTVLSIGSFWLYTSVLLHGLRGSHVPNLVEIGLATTAVFILVGMVALACGQILRRTVRQTIAAQKALFKSEKQLQDILQTTPDIIYRLDPEGRITFVNEAIRRYGYDPSRLIQTRFLDYLYPQDRDLVTHRLDERSRGARRTRSLEVRLLTSWGEQRVVECTEMPVEQVPVVMLQAEGLHEGGAGPEHHGGIQGIARDITDRKRAEDALKKSEEMYSRVFRAAPAGISVATLDEARFVDVNEEFERISGFMRGELIGRSALDVGLWADPRDRDRVIELLKMNAPTTDLEMQVRTKNKELRTVRGSGELVGIGDTMHLLLEIVDITDRKRLQSQLQQAQKLEAIGRLAGGIAHDFNNMLTVILGQAEMAFSDLVPANPLYERIREIRRVAERSAELTRQLLVFARRQDAAPGPLDLNRAISESVEMLRRLIGENVALKWNPAPSPLFVKMDPTQVDQILINLVVNARDAIADVGTLTMSTESRLQKEIQPPQGEGEGLREWVILTVTDSGAGMGAESLAHLFEPFFTTKEVGKGTGMGLATVYGIVQHAGGRIEVESELGKGTTFRVCMPRTLETACTVREADQGELSRGGETVLVVEDEPGILKITRSNLQRLGYSVVAAASPADALACSAHHGGPLHLLLTDVVMPEMNGLDLYTRIATSHPGIRVIFMSGYSEREFPRSDSGGQGAPFLQKPFSMRQLAAKVREVLDADQNPSTSRSRGEQGW